MTIYQSVSSFQVFPNDLNFGNTLFGGKLLAEIDCEASKVARNVVYGTEATNVVTASFDRVNFLHPGEQGDMIIMFADVVEFGTTSMKINVDCYIKRGPDMKDWILLCNAKTTFVAKKGKENYAHGKTMPRE